MKVDTFEQFLNTQYKTTKRFGVDGGEALQFCKCSQLMCQHSTNC